MLTLLSLTGQVQDPELDCGWRRLAYKYAHELQALSSDEESALRDALRLAETCGGIDSVTVAQTAASTCQDQAGVIFVSTSRGTNGAAGTFTAPLARVGEAVRAARHAGINTIKLRGGTYFLREGEVELLAADSGLTIASCEGEVATLSGGQPLSGLKWTPVPGTQPRIFMTTLNQTQQKALPHGMPALRVGGQRVTRARFPNADPERSQFPIGYIANRTTWQPPVYPPYNTNVSIPCDPTRQCGTSKNITMAAPPTEWHGLFQNFSVGVGGGCDVYTPAYSAWCSGDFYVGRMRGGGIGDLHVRAPSGIIGASTLLPNGPYADPSGAVVFGWRPAHWYTWMFEVSRAKVETDGSQSLLFGGGGNQGGEGADFADEWYIENVFEELDAPGEFFYSPSDGKLFLVANGSSWSPPAEVVVPSLATLIRLNGSRAKPVVNITLAGLVLQDTRPTFLEPRTTPTGGDWALERTAALVIDGSEGTAVRDSRFERIDGNAVLLSGYNRDSVLEGNTFVWLGQSAIAAWGYTDGERDGGPPSNLALDGDYPRRTLVRSNICREIGIWQKQSSCFFQAATAETVLSNNIFYNLPRAAVSRLIRREPTGGGGLLQGFVTWFIHVIGRLES